MRILMIHNRYLQKGGEDTVFYNEAQMLDDGENEIFQFVVSNDSIKTNSLVEKIKLGINTIWSISSYKKVKSYIKKIEPDVVHVHNTFPLLSPSIYWAIKSVGIPIIQTLHNYRLGCANGILYRESEICQKCIDKNIFYSVYHGCYRESKIQTLPVALMQGFHRLIGTYSNKIDRYIALTEFSREKFMEIGLPKEKIVVKPNFTLNPYTNKFPKDFKRRKKQIIYVGRITEDKGLEILLNSFTNLNMSNANLLVIGEGEKRIDYQEKYKFDSRISWLGSQEKEKVIDHISDSTMLVMSSLWYETFGMVLIEAMSVGTPIIAPNHGGFSEIVIENRNGFTYNRYNSNDLMLKMKQLMELKEDEWNKFSESCFEDYNVKYSKVKNKNALLNIYREATVI